MPLSPPVPTLAPTLEPLIPGALLHLPGIGPVREQRLRDAGLDSWAAIQSTASWPLAETLHAPICAVIAQNQHDLECDRLLPLCQTLRPIDHWRILAEHFPRAAWFDIETTGLDRDSAIAMIACYHQGELHYFYEHENLDDFLELLAEIKLLVSFNGASFDVPRVLDYFHIPELPCAHLDLRWLCYHQAHRGGLKAIARTMGIHRPEDIESLAGDDAIRLWKAWRRTSDPAFKTLLTRYCAADVVLLPLVTECALREKEIFLECLAAPDLWSLLPAHAPVPEFHEEYPSAASSLSVTTSRRSRLKFFR